MLFSPQPQIDAIPPARTYRAGKRAPRKNFLENRAAPENFYAQALRAPRKNAALYGESAPEPTVGRYISSDPAGQAGGLNTFLYAAASPVMWIDPDGLRFRRRPGTFGDQSQINDIIDQAYNMLKCSKAGDWFRQQLQQVGNGLTLEDMFYGNSAEYFYGYYQGPLYGDGHTNWSPVFGPEWGFPGQPDQTMGMTVGSLDWSTKASAKLFIHEAAQALIGQTNYPDKFYAQTVSDSSGMFSDLVGQPGTCGCGGSN